MFPDREALAIESEERHGYCLMLFLGYLGFQWGHDVPQIFFNPVRGESSSIMENRILTSGFDLYLSWLYYIAIKTEG